MPCCYRVNNGWHLSPRPSCAYCAMSPNLRIPDDRISVDAAHGARVANPSGQDHRVLPGDHDIPEPNKSSAKGSSQRPAGLVPIGLGHDYEVGRASMIETIRP